MYFWSVQSLEFQLLGLGIYYSGFLHAPIQHTSYAREAADSKSLDLATPITISLYIIFHKIEPTALSGSAASVVFACFARDITNL